MHCTLAFVISDDMSEPFIFRFAQQFLKNLFVQKSICSIRSRLENDFTIISKITFRLFWSSFL